MDKTEKEKLLEKLQGFYEGMLDYSRLTVGLANGQLTRKEQLAFEQERVDLQRAYGGLKPEIEQYGGKAVIFITPHNKPREEHDAFRKAFLKPRVHEDVLRMSRAIDACVSSVNLAIGNVESLESPEKQQVQLPRDITQIPIFLFDNMKLHPKIIEVSESRFKTGHYADAITAAFKAVNNYVKKKTGLDLDGKNLMLEVFSKNKPIIKLNNGKTTSEIDEQEGFMHLFAGAMQGIRNPKVHDETVELDAYRTLEYLGFASLLMRRAEEGKLKIVSQPVKKAPAPSPR